MARTQVQSELIATNAISGTIIADNAITATHIAQNSISGILIPDSGITTTMIASNNVTAAKIVTGAVANRHLASTVISSQSAVTAVDGDYVLIGDTSDSNNLKKSLVSDLIQTDEEIADIVGAMVSSNTESGITVAYQDGDNTIDFTVGTLNQNTTGTAATVTTAAQTNITSVGTLTGLTGGTGDLIWDSPTFVVDSSTDRVGIGTATPASDLHIKGSGDTKIIIEDGSVQQSIVGHSGGLNYQVVAGDAHTFVIDGVDKMIIDSAGTINVVKNAKGTLTTDNDGSFDLEASNNFKCTPSGNFTLTFTNIDNTQTGNILLVNSGGHTVSAHANTKNDANLLATVSAAGTYLISYFSDGTNVYLTNSAIYT